MIILAVDPGKDSSWARFDTARPHEIEVGVFERIGIGRMARPSPIHVREIGTDADAAVVEEVGARPGEGVTSVFTFGLAVGTVLGALACPVSLVSPQEWKRASRLGGLKGEEAKTAARQYAMELWPQHHALFRVKKNHGLAEACLMARWYFLAGPGRHVSMPAATASAAG